MTENQRGLLLTTEEVATRLRVNPCTVRRWRLDDVGPMFLEVGNIYRYLADELEAWIAGSVRTSLAS
ncbi:helix-turn-helix domain-containing protein [Rhodococcus indonesiensis]